MMHNYDKFVAGIDEVSRVEQDLVAAHKTAKVTACISIALASLTALQGLLRTMLFLK